MLILKNAGFLFFLLLVIPFSIFAQAPIRPDSTYRTKPLIEDDQVILMLDSLANLKIFEETQFPNTNQYQNWSNYSDSDIPVFSDSVYRERIALMNDQSPFEYVYNNEVKNFIAMYSVRKRKLTARILGLAQIYFPLFEEQLDKFNMPLELKYLAVIESALNPIANSPAGAKGLWQFMYGTGKGYGLKVSTYVDDRFDPYKSTIAACEHLSDLYDIYGSWSLALAAYNSGAGNVNKAIRRSGGIKNFWAIKKYLPKETASYVPAFIAASYVINYASEHKIYPVDPGILYYEVDTVTIKQPLSFAQISEMLNIPMDEIVMLNPTFKQRLIPATSENPYKLWLRKKYIGPFINNEIALYAYRTREGLASDSLERLIFKNYRDSELYTVKSGETVTSIAKKFNMTTSELKSLNGLKKNSIKPSKKILVYSKPKDNKRGGEITSKYVPQPIQKDSAAGANIAAGKSEPSAPEQKPSSSSLDEKPKMVYIVKSGESIALIAQKCGCTSNDLIKWNNLKNQTVLVGQKLKVASTCAPTTSGKKTNSKTSSAKTASTAKPASYTIQAGDNLWEIADRYNVTVSQIKSLNGLKNNSRLSPGQKIKIPK
ncbi:MAG: LysM peptidoglycan-binding domain-containing protein [Bacteroidetes bacterium]|nr:LysM peptidoglycan-binding domain-containing protein [Bacteroidota bacterium]